MAADDLEARIGALEMRIAKQAAQIARLQAVTRRLTELLRTSAVEGAASAALALGYVLDEVTRVQPASREDILLALEQRLEHLEADTERRPLGMVLREALALLRGGEARGKPRRLS